MNPPYRQEVLNVILAQLLQERGLVSAPENMLTVAGEPERSMPDVLVRFNGLRTVIEGEVDDRAGAADSALRTAHRRVEQGIAHIGIAVVYPQSLRHEGFGDLKDRLAACELRMAIVTEAGETDFTSGGIDDLGTGLRRSFAELLQEDIVGRATLILDAGVEFVAGAIVGKAGWVGRLSDTLGIRPLPPRPKREREGDAVD
jgi:hypothetical protein